MSKKKIPTPVEKSLWSRAETYEIQGRTKLIYMPDDCVPEYGDTRYFPVDTIGLIKAVGSIEQYAVNDETLTDKMLKEFIDIALPGDQKVQLSRMTKWLKYYGLPVESSHLSANQIYNAAYSMWWLKGLLEVACSEPDRKGKTCDRLKKSLIIVDREAQEDIKISFSPFGKDSAFFVFNFRNADDKVQSKAGTNIVRFVWQSYKKGSVKVDSLSDLKFLAKQYISAALGFLLSGIRPSIIWKMQKDGSLTAYEILTVTNPWQAMNYRLHKLLRTNGDIYKACEICGAYFLIKTVRGEYCSGKCRQQNYRNKQKQESRR